MKPLPALTALVVSLVSACVPRPVEPAGTFVIRNVRVFDGDGIAQGQDVLVANGVISRVGATGAAVPARATVIEGSGRTLLPGLISHSSNQTFNPSFRKRSAMGRTMDLSLEL